MTVTETDIWRLYGSISLPFEGRQLESELGAKPIALLVALIANGGPVSREELASMLWPDSSHESARHNLRQALFAVRKALGRKVPEFTMYDYEGNPVSYSDAKGDVTMLAFWFPT